MQSSIVKVASISLPPSSRAYGVAAIGSQDSETILWVTLSNRNSIIPVNSETLEVGTEIAVGPKPMGIAADDNDNLWVCNYDDDTVSKVSNGQVVDTFLVGEKPLEIVYFAAAGKLVGTLSGSNQLFVIDKTTEAVTYVTVGNNPWGIVASGNDIYVTNSADSTFTKLTNLAVVSTTATKAIPYNIAIDSAGKIFIACIGDSVIQVFSGTTLFNEFDVSWYPFGLSNDSTDVYLVTAFGGLPPRTMFWSQTPDSFSFTPVVRAVPSTSYTSDTITISGLAADATVPVSIPPISGASLVINGASAGTSGSAVNGTTIRITGLSGSELGDLTEIELAVGTKTGSYSITNTKRPQLPKYLTFTDLLNVPINSTQNSETNNVANILAITTFPASATNGTIYKDGVLAGASTTFTLGNTIALSTTAPNIANGTKYVTLSYNSQPYVWRVKTSGPTAFPDITHPAVYDEHGVLITDEWIEIIDPPENPFIDVEDIELNTNVDTTNTILMTGVTPGTSVSIQPYVGASILKNGIPIGTSTTVQPTDRIGLRLLTPDFYYFPITLKLSVGDIDYDWTVRTIPWKVPDDIGFRELFDVVPRTEISSAPFTISGIITDEVEVEISVKHGELSINGGTRSKTGLVKNGDTVIWYLSPFGPYNGYHKTYYVSFPETNTQFGWALNTMYLVGPVKQISREKVDALGTFGKMVQQPKNHVSVGMTGVKQTFKFKRRPQPEPMKRTLVEKTTEGMSSVRSTREDRLSLNIVLAVRSDNVIRTVPLNLRQKQFLNTNRVVHTYWIKDTASTNLWSSEPFKRLFPEHTIEALYQKREEAQRTIDAVYLKREEEQRTIEAVYLKQYLPEHIAIVHGVKPTVPERLIYPVAEKLESFIRTFEPQPNRTTVVPRTAPIILTPIVARAPSYKVPMGIRLVHQRMMIKSRTVSRASIHFEEFALPVPFRASVSDTLFIPPLGAIRAHVHTETSQMPAAMVSHRTCKETSGFIPVKSDYRTMTTIVAEPMKVHFVLHGDVGADYWNRGRFATMEDAIAAGLEVTPTPIPYQLPDGSWVWTREDCASVPPGTILDKVSFYGWMQGG